MCIAFAHRLSESRVYYFTAIALGFFLYFKYMLVKSIERVGFGMKTFHSTGNNVFYLPYAIGEWSPDSLKR
jgi:hypothetical protein